jgi:hypothetical protein
LFIAHPARQFYRQFLAPGLLSRSATINAGSIYFYQSNENLIIYGFSVLGKSSSSGLNKEKRMINQTVNRMK